MKEPLTLGELISKLEKTTDKTSKNKGVYFDFCHTVPIGIGSYRGYYDQLAIEWGGGNNRGVEGELNLLEFIKLLKETEGKTFEGYKGGQFKMGLETPVWVANYSCVGDTAIIKVKDFKWCTILKTTQIKT